MLYNNELEYEIVGFYPTSGQIVVFSAKSGIKHAIDLPIQDNRYPEGEDLDNYIKGFFPIWLTGRAENLNVGIENADYIANLVTKNPSSEYKRSLLETIRQQRTSLLYNTDWTQIPDCSLSEEYKEKFRIYRQQLRDITKQDLNNIEWPTNPFSN